MRIALIEPPIIRPKDEGLGIECEAPMALMSLASILLQRDHSVSIIDAFAEGYFNREIKNNHVYVGLKFEQILQRIVDFNSNVVGISSIFYFNLPTVMKLANYLKENIPNIYVVLGGVAPTTLYKDLIKCKGIDFIVLREGDYILPELIENIQAPSKVPGLIWKEGSEIHINRESSLPEDLDRLPFPSRELVNLDLYLRIGKPFGFVKERKRFTTLLTSRGCPFSCSFCSAGLIHGKAFRYRSAENVLSEIEELVNKFNVTELHIIDENFTLNKQRAMEIMDGLIERGYNKFLSWTCPNGLFANSLDEKMIDKMQKSNCHSVALAIESGDPDVSEKLAKKHINHNHVEKIIKYFKENTNILLCGYFIIGFPGETKKQIMKTLNFANKLQMHNATISILMPYPFTEIYDKLIKGNQQPFKDSNCYYNLLPKHGIIQTSEFSPSWLKAIQETDRFLALFRKKRKPLWTLCWELVRRNGWMAPRVAGMILYHTIKGDISGKT